MAMIFQDPLSALHPYYTVGVADRRGIRVHHSRHEGGRAARAIDLLEPGRHPQPPERVDQYPHEFSGGMRQRAMIAMSLVNDPELLIADEPTTALDVTVQAQILDLMRDLQKEFGSAIIMITHDLGVVAEIADDVLVMYGGRAVEYGPVNEIFDHPEHPYTWGLLTSMPRLDRARKSGWSPFPGNPPSLINVPAGAPSTPAAPSVTWCPMTAAVPSSPVWTRPRRATARCLIPTDERARVFADVVKPRL